MALFRITPFFLLVLQHSGTVAVRDTYHTVREGDDIALACEIEDQNQCESTNWDSVVKGRVLGLFKRGHIGKNVNPSVRLLQNCSLLLRRVTAEQKGAYICSENSSTYTQRNIHYLSVVILSQSTQQDRVTYNCSVKDCYHNVTWLNNNNQEVTKDHTDLQMSQYHSFSVCWASVSFKNTSPPSPSHRALKCEIRQRLSTEIFTFFPKFKDLPPTSLTNCSCEETPTTATHTGFFLRHVLLSAGLLALILSVVTVLLYTKVKGSRMSRSHYSRAYAQSSVMYENTREEPSVSIRLQPRYEN
ncbi:hypothetical protein WMY93_014789 [Mugilogobius chulae]|uniref:Ig-like domain-containing protein n=1 Tax=Mugilogobius chulae TaxID=88201 RepID=A0AAW0P263_9GOBI